MEYIITGRAAHGRVGNLFQNLLKEENESCIDKSPYATTTKNEDIGAPLWAFTDVHKAMIITKPYEIGNVGSFSGVALGLKIMGQQDSWGNDAFFDYYRRAR